MTTFTRPVETYIVTCPNQDNGKIIKMGKQSGVQRYRCKTCGKSFREPDEFQQGRQFRVQQIGQALQGYFDGQSYREAARNVSRTFDTEPPDESSVFRWVQGYARGAHEAMKHVKVPTGSEWVCDEMVVRVGGEKFWLWSVMDKESRYILATNLSPRRTQMAAEVTFRKAIEASANLPKRITTDGLGSYVPAIETLLPYTEHNVSPGLDSENNNNRSERLQGTMRDRDKVLRGLDSREAGQNYLDGWVIDYNLFRPHMALDERTPAQVAGVVAPFRNWRDVARLVKPIGKPNRPDWQTTDERPLRRTKDFKTMPIDVAEEAAPRALRPKAFKSSFKKRRGF